MGTATVNVFSRFSVPVDAINLDLTLSRIDEAIESRKPLLISTPNVNFLVTSWNDRSFREAILISDLCPVDGMPLVWIARFLKMPIKGRVAGSDIFNALKQVRGGRVGRPRTFLFGRADGLARNLGEKLNSGSGGMKSVGAISPGFGTIEEMSGDHVIKAINSSGADFLAIFLTAKKAQGWLLHNYDRLIVPVRGQFGATINFEAGTVKRAPSYMRTLGFEWLWRIKEEPYLWSRYWRDGLALATLGLFCVLPILAGQVIRSFRRSAPLGLYARISEDGHRVVVRMVGDATSEFIENGVEFFRSVLDSGKSVEIDLSGGRYLDQRYFGLLLMIRKHLMKRGQSLTFSDMPPKMRKKFILNRFQFLLEAER